jgi:hypothetical protein
MLHLKLNVFHILQLLDGFSFIALDEHFFVMRNLFTKQSFLLQVVSTFVNFCFCLILMKRFYFEQHRIKTKLDSLLLTFSLNRFSQFFSFAFIPEKSSGTDCHLKANKQFITSFPLSFHVYHIHT